jgi:hypothetical protein
MKEWGDGRAVYAEDLEKQTQRQEVIMRVGHSANRNASRICRGFLRRYTQLLDS